MSTILVVEDDEAIRDPLARALRREGYEVTVASTGADALEAAQGAIDLVVLDLGLPDMDGLDVCRALRDRGRPLSVLMLTARTSEIDTVLGLDAGADDYVPKPFRLAELLARVRARLRDAPAARSDRVRSQTVTVDIDAHRAWNGATELDLTPKEFDLLALLVAEAGMVVSRERIMREVWDEHWWGSTRTLDMHISALRKKLGDDPANPRFIATVRGVGFRFESG